MTLAVEGAQRLDSYPKDRLHLYKNDYTPTIDTILADLTEADFSGYSSVSFAGSATGVDSDGYPIRESAVVLYEHNGGAIINTIYGFFIMDNNQIKYAERLASPVDMETTGDVLTIRLTYRFGD